MAANDLARLVVSLEAQTSQYVRQLDRANAKLDRFTRRQQRGVDRVKNAFRTLAAGIGVGALIRFGGQALESADNMAKLVDRLGGSTEAFSELEFVANRSGVSFRTLTLGLQRMSRRVAEAAQGTGEARNALRELNLDAAALTKIPIDRQFEIIADRLAGVSSEADRTRLAMKLFDSEGVALLQTMTRGAAGIQELRARARELGVTLDADAAQKAVAARDALTDFQARANATARELTIALIPALTAGVEALRKFTVGLRFAFSGGTGAEPLAREIQFAEKALAKLQFELRRGEQGGPFGLFKASEDELVGLRSTIELTERKLEQLKARQLDLLTGGTGGAAATTPAEQSLNNIAEAATTMSTQAENAFRSFVRQFDTADQAIQRNLATLEQYKAQLDPAEFERIKTAIETGIVDPLQEFEADFRAIVQRTRTPAERFRQSVQNLLANPLIDADLQEREIKRLTEVLHRELGVMTDSTKSAVAKMSEFSKQAARNMQDSFANFLFDPFADGLDGMLRGFLDTLRRMVANDLAARVFNFLNITGGGGGLLGLFGRQFGGSVRPGQPYLVGESGGRPELFIPNTAGTIVPSGGMGGNVFSFHTVIQGGGDAKTLLPLIDERDRKLKAEIIEELNRGAYR